MSGIGKSRLGFGDTQWLESLSDEERARAYEEDDEICRREVTCAVMSRSLVFCWAEAFSRDLAWPSIPWKAERAVALAEAIEFGMLKLDWGRP